MSPKKGTPKKRSFSSFNYAEACQQLNLTELLPWEIEFTPIPPSDFLKERLQRLRKFDLQLCERSKELLIDALFEETIQPSHHLKIWKGANLASDTLIGEVDYVVATAKAYLDTPMLCVVEAKKDDFEQGVAQCLVEMQACQWLNRQALGETIPDILGIVSNGHTWQFYKLTSRNAVYESLPYSIGTLDDILGLLISLFQSCDQLLSRLGNASH